MKIKNIFFSRPFQVLVIVVLAVSAYTMWSLQGRRKPKPSFEHQITIIPPADLRWVVIPTLEKLESLDTIFAQPFYFLDQGKQSTAFVSKDDRYVLKFLLEKPLVIKPQFNQLPNIFPFTLLKEYKSNERVERKEALFSSFLLSYNVVPNETGTLFVHLSPTTLLHKEIFIIDSQENPHLLDLDRVQWVLQRRAHHIKPTIANLMWAGKEVNAKRRIDQIFALLLACAKRGVMDADSGLIRNNNIGFLEDRAIYIDTGKLRFSETIKHLEYFKKDLQRLAPLYKWLKIYYPSLADYFEEKQKQVVSSFYTSIFN